jgi:hypothetical protein
MSVSSPPPRPSQSMPDPPTAPPKASLAGESTPTPTYTDQQTPFPSPPPPQGLHLERLSSGREAGPSLSPDERLGQPSGGDLVEFSRDGRLLAVVSIGAHTLRCACGGGGVGGWLAYGRIEGACVLRRGTHPPTRACACVWTGWWTWRRASRSGVWRGGPFRCGATRTHTHTHAHIRPHAS